MPEFTHDEYLMTTKPYDFIYTYRDNNFVMEQLVKRMEKAAADKDVRGFVGLWKKYLKSLGSNTRIVDVNATEFPGLPVEGGELECGRYICNVYGVYYIDKSGAEKMVCSQMIAPIKRYKNIDTNEELLEIWFSRGSADGGVVSETRIVSKDVIAGNIISLAKYGVAVSRKNDKDLSAYLLEVEQLNYDKLPEEQSVKRLGWIGEGFHEFSPYVEHIVFDGEEDFGGVFGSVRSCGSYSVWLETARKVRKQKTVARIYLAASFASAILKPCGLLPFIVHAWGGTENGKTVSLMLAASVWACPEPGEYVATFNGTRYAQETRAGFLNNLPMCLDELQIQASQNVKDFDNIIYQLCEGVSKSQGKSSGGLRRQTKWRNVILSNGEHTIIKPLSGGGARNRVIELEAPEKIYPDLVGLCETINNNYGFAGREWVNWLMDPQNMERVRNAQKEFYAKFLDLEITEKQAGSASAILAADQLATEVIFRDGHALTVEELAAYLLRKGDIDINRRALEWLLDYVATESAHFNGGTTSGSGGPAIWGKVDEDEGVIYFIRSAFDVAMKEHGLDPKAFLSWAVRTGHALTGPEGWPTKTCRIPGANGAPRCVMIRMSTGDGIGPELEELDGIDDIPF